MCCSYFVGSTIDCSTIDCLIESNTSQCTLMASRKRSISNDADISSLQKEWDEVSCPICMDHPHNAVLILCSSHENGCRSFICDTSYRHSNCLDRFKKPKQENTETSTIPSLGHELDGLSYEESNNEKLCERVPLKCPLCRGKVLGWKVVEDAREYLNLKSRSCSSESCLFCGNYGELRRHARRDHPMVHPADVDPSRQREWCRLENQTELNDIVTAIRSAMPGAILVGDYAIESGNRVSSESDTERGRWLSTLFLFRMMGSLEGEAPRRGGRARGMSSQRRGGRASRHRYFWGETLMGLQDMEEEAELEAEADEGRREPRLEQNEDHNR